MERRRTALAAALLALAIGPAARAEGGKGMMQIGLVSHYVWPQDDAHRFDPAFDYGVVFHYWLNSTTSIMAGVEQLSFHAPFEVDGIDRGVVFTSTALLAGLRYNPPLDLWVSPYIELGLGYQSWQVKPGLDALNSRSGANVIYFGGAGLSYDFRHVLTVGANVRYLYYPMRENIEVSAVQRTVKKYHVTRDPFTDFGFVTAGVELSWRFK